MRIARSVEELTRDDRSVVTVGTFDGVHIGHRAIMRTLTATAAARRARSVAVTFDPHPREVVGRGPVELLTTTEERLGLLEAEGVDAVLLLGFTYEFSRQTAGEFTERTIVRGTGAAEVIVGYDHMFGRDRTAGISELRAIGAAEGFGVTIVDPVSLHGRIVSSSRIREFLAAGEAERAAEFLGRPYALTGTVVRGDGRGRAIGFPTANIVPSNPRLLVPAQGVYVVSAVVGEGERRYGGMLNIGVRPTLTAGTERTVEAHLFGAGGSWYGERLRVEFLTRLRAERKFSSKEQLIAQLEADRSASLAYLAGGTGAAGAGREKEKS